MANPVQMICAKDVWTKIYTNVTEKNFWLQINDYTAASKMEKVYVAWKDTGSQAPDNGDFSTAVLMDENFGTFKRTTASDVYLCPVGDSVPVLLD